MKQILLLLIGFLLVINSSFAQKWVEMMEDPTVNFYTVQKEFNNYWQEKQKELTEEEKNAMEGKEIPGYNIYKRWEARMEPRVYPTGNRIWPEVDETFSERVSEHCSGINSSNWTLIGPTMLPTQGGVGRVNIVRLHPTIPNTLYAMASSGGMWKSTNGGSSWSTTTDQLGVVGSTDLAFDPTNPDIMYLATGDGDAGDTKSIGIVKSTDGGVTWTNTGLTYPLSQQVTISRVIVHPTNPNIILVAGNKGVLRSTDAGATWTSAGVTGNFKAMVLKPGDPNTVYAASTDIYRSTDNGITFTKLTSGLPTSGSCNRYALAVTPQDPAYLYVCASGTNSNLKGIYRSTDSGDNFTVRATTPNLLGGQGWYDNCIAVNPTNVNELLVGGVGFYKSTDGGATWASNANTAFGSGCHGDFHDIQYINGTTYYVGTDGGVSKTINGGTSYTDLSSGMHTALIYGFGQSEITPYLTLSGWQDNGYVKSSGPTGGTWKRLGGGDGCISFIDWSSDQYMYTSNVGGGILGSTNSGANFSNIKGNINESGLWITPFSQDPVNSATIYAGYKNMWKSTTRGTTWTKISSFTWSNVSNFAVAKSNPSIIYATNGSTLQKTVSGGAAWLAVTGLPSGAITDIAIDNNDPNKVWVCYSGYNAANKVFYTANGGTSWTNITLSLPNVPVNTIVKDHTTADEIYIGTDAGVYIYSSAAGGWSAFSTGLPNMEVSQLEISYAFNKIRAASFGRGLWESPLNSITSTPENAELNKMEVYPNPTKGIITINNISAVKGDFTVRVTNVLGEVIFTENNIGILTKTIDISKAPAGIYLVSISNNDSKTVRKIIKE